MLSRALARERLTGAGAVFETLHSAQSTLRYHQHDRPFLTIVMRGSYTEVCDTAPHSCHSGTLVVHGAREEHADYFDDAAVCLNVELPEADGSLIFSDPVILNDAVLQAAARNVARSFYQNGDDLTGAVEALHRVVLAPRAAEPALPGWLETAMKHFSWTESVPMREAAGIAGIHHAHFSRAFRRHLGMTPNEYRRRARIRLASELLLGSAASLSRIALHCGFTDQSHFTRTFSETVGISPSNYRRIFTP